MTAKSSTTQAGAQKVPHPLLLIRRRKIGIAINIPETVRKASHPVSLRRKRPLFPRIVLALAVVAVVFLAIVALHPAEFRVVRTARMALTWSITSGFFQKALTNWKSVSEVAVVN